MSIFSLASSLLPLYILVFLGVLVGRVTTIKPGQLAELLIYFLSPAVVLYGAYQADLNSSLWLLPIVGFVLSAFLLMLGLGMAQRLYPTDDGSARISAFAISTGNTGYFGIPAVLALLGPDALAPVVMLSFGFTLYESTLGYYILQRHQLHPIDAVKRVLKLPIAYAFVCGLCLNLLGLTLPETSVTVLDMLRIAFTVLGMMIVGLALSDIKWAHMDMMFHLFVHSAKFLLVPCIALCVIALDLMVWHLFDPHVHQIILIQSLVPLAANVSAFAAMFDMRPQTAALAVMISTCGALIVLPVGLSLLLPYIS